ncbi:MAG: TIGR01777 family oxidoreductase [Nitrospiraceae bacterium]
MRDHKEGSTHIVIAGGTGFIGRPRAVHLAQAGHQVTILSRAPGAAVRHLTLPIVTLVWDGRSLGPWTKALEGAAAVVNLAGEPIANGRWTKARKQLLWDSRVGTTAMLVQALSQTASRPQVLLNASGIGFYGAGDGSLTENAPAGSGFLADLSQAWEREAVKAEVLGLRVVRMRFGMVLGADGGALPRMLLPFQWFLGGPISPGDQWVSWIHRQDLVELIQWVLMNQHVNGPVNGVAPGAVTMKEFCRTLGQALGRPSWIPVPAFALKLALGELATLMTTGQRVEPAVALSGGFRFRYPNLKAALEQIVETAPRTAIPMQASL